MRRKEAGHYLRTPLTVVKGTLELLLRRWDHLSDDEKRRYVTLALTATDKVTHAVTVVEQKILHNKNITIVLDETQMTTRVDEDNDAHTFRVL